MSVVIFETTAGTDLQWKEGRREGRQAGYGDDNEEKGKKILREHHVAHRLSRRTQLKWEGTKRNH